MMPVKWEQLIQVVYNREVGEEFPRTFECGPGTTLRAVLKNVNGKAWNVSESISAWLASPHPFSLPPIFCNVPCATPVSISFLYTVYLCAILWQKSAVSVWCHELWSAAFVSRLVNYDLHISGTFILNHCKAYNLGSWGSWYMWSVKVFKMCTLCSEQHL